MRKDRSVAQERPYHHGQLREALVDAAHALIAEHGVEGFTLADACRQAGVSTAAPYRHFRDRSGLIEALVARGFGLLEARMRARAAAFAEGSAERIIAIGQAYVAFAEAEPALFRLMFGRSPELKSADEVRVASGSCFGTLLEAVSVLQKQRGIEHLDLFDLALPLWSLVHGVASLKIDGAFDARGRVVDLDLLVERTTKRFFQGLAEPA